jgi:rhamnulokinase
MASTWSRSWHAAVDLGASSARVIAGRYQNGRLEMRELARFANRPIMLPDGFHWDLVGLFGDTVGALAKGCSSLEIASVGIDGWAVDYCLLDADGRLLGLPYCYRDPRTAEPLRKVLADFGAWGLYEATGIQILALNTLFQLIADLATPAYLAASTMLLLPDAFVFLLTGKRQMEATNASTTQLFDVRDFSTAKAIWKRFGLREDLLAPMVWPGHFSGRPLKAIAAHFGLPSDLEVVTVASHDTASAVAAVPAEESFAFVSAGTWSLVGAELQAPLITEASLRLGFSNEVGVDGTYRFLRNVMGYWIVQECERYWRDLGDEGLRRVRVEAERRRPFELVVDADHPGFHLVGGMPKRIANYLSATGQQVPSEPGGILRAAVDGVVLATARAVEDLVMLSGLTPRCLHVIGGGSAHSEFCLLLASAVGLPVVAGPKEASSVGNLLMQIRAAEPGMTLAEARSIVAASVDTVVYEPDPRLARLARAALERLGGLVEERGRLAGL